MNRFPHQINYNLGSIDSQPAEQATFLIDDQYENDVYEFTTGTTSNINISLNNISEGDDADLRLYSDSNQNGILDSSDLEINSSLNFSNDDESINYQASAGTYFARVNYFDGGDDGRIDYEIDLASDITGQVGVGSSTIATNRDFGISLFGEAAAVETGSISNSNTSDTYGVSVVNGETIDITLDGLSSDADLRVIQDHNQNNIVDTGEVYASSLAGGTSSETISLSEEGDYFVEVFQFSGSTDYTLQFDQEFV